MKLRENARSLVDMMWGLGCGTAVSHFFPNDDVLTTVGPIAAIGCIYAVEYFLARWKRRIEGDRR